MKTDVNKLEKHQELEDSKIPKGFIKNYDLIQEDCKVDDLLDFSDSINAFSNRLDSIKTPSIIGLVGKFGSGKSTMLYQIQKQNEEKEKWIIFDAWKYPDRKDLWEGFVLDFADQLGERKKTQSAIDGKDKKTKIIDCIKPIASKLTLGVAEPFAELLKTSPAKRVFEIQEILKRIIENHEGPIRIVVEDVDRSGDAGIYFLETMKQFLRDTNVNQNIIVIVPIGDEKYKGKSDSYHKCLDYIDQFQPSIKGLSKFVEEIVDDNLFVGQFSYTDGRTAWTGEARKGQLSSFFEEILRRQLCTIRELKQILRHADLIFKQQTLEGYEPDFRVTICFEIAKHHYVNEDSNLTWFENIRKHHNIPTNNIYAIFMRVMIDNITSIYKDHKTKELYHPKQGLKLISRTSNNQISQYPSWPYIGNIFDVDEEKDKNVFCVCDFYLDY